MGQPVVWFEVIGTDRDALLGFYCELFGWRASPVGGWPYSTIDTGAEEGIGGGIGEPTNGVANHVTFYVRVDDVAAALEQVEELGGEPVMGPTDMPGGTVALFADPEGHVIGLHRPA